MQVAFETLGCRLNEAESEAWARRFRAQGASVVPVPQADVIVLNSCAVTGEAVRKSRQLIRRLKRTNPHARLVVSGCYATLHPGEAAEALGVDLVVLNRDKDRLVEMTRHLLPGGDSEPDHCPYPPSRQRAFIKVQDGCRHRCTFCIVTVARGEERSRPIEAVIEEILELRESGVQEAVLSGVHLGGYGNDLGLKLTDLIEAVLTQTELPRLRLGSLEPWELNEDFFSLLSHHRMMPHLHLPLQSGSDTILKRMGRRCRSQDFIRLIEKARSHRPDLTVTTDMIVGFPGETEQDFEKSLQLAREVGFAHIHIFPYSPRAGTAAASFPGQVEAGTKKERSRRLQQLAASLRQQILSRHLHQTQAVLFERARDEEGGRFFCGYTPHFLRVKVNACDGHDLTNSIRMVRLKAVNQEGDQLLGTLATNSAFS